MKKLLIFLFGICSFSVEWQPYRNIVNNPEILKPGDIIVYEKTDRFITQFGHTSVVNKEMKIVDFKRVGYGYFELPIYAEHDYDRRIKILRYNKMDEEFLNLLEDEMWTFNNKLYNIFVDKDGDPYYTYCSQFIYQIFREVGKKLGREINFKIGDKQIFEPYDLFTGNDFEIIEAVKE